MSSQHTVAVSISSAQRNRARWPNPNKYEVTLPMAMQRVRQVVLAGIDVPLHQRLIEGEGAFLPFAEGLTFEQAGQSAAERTWRTLQNVERKVGRLGATPSSARGRIPRESHASPTNTRAAVPRNRCGR